MRRADFHAEVFPTLKEKYVDTGKVRFICGFPSTLRRPLRCWRCAGTAPSVHLDALPTGRLGLRQDDPRPELQVCQAGGLHPESFEQCLTDQKLLDDISAVRERAADTFGVNSTPTFFINGKKMSGGPTLDEFDKAFGSLLKS
jgi:protein-disulfide isomerase